jgi:hypothetical protein
LKQENYFKPQDSWKIAQADINNKQTNKSCTISSVKFIDTKEMTFKAFWKAKLV